MAGRLGSLSADNREITWKSIAFGDRGVGIRQLDSVKFVFDNSYSVLDLGVLKMISELVIFFCNLLFLCLEYLSLDISYEGHLRCTSVIIGINRNLSAEINARNKTP